MTGNELFNIAISLMGENNETAQSYISQALNVINVLIADTFEINNMIRENKGELPLELPPYISLLSDSIPYDEDILHNLLPYGVGSRLVIDDGDPNKLGFLEQNYVERYNMYRKTKYSEIGDVW